MNPRPLLACLSFAVAACQPSAVSAASVTAATPAPIASAGAASDAASASNAFGAELHGQLSKTTGNLFYSPSSVALALAMAREGARGATATEMDAVLHLTGRGPGAMGALGAIAASGDGKTAPEIRVANRLWADGRVGLDPAYVAVTKSAYAASAQSVDFMRAPEPSRLAINGWVAGETHDKIRDLLPQGSITPDTRLVLTNAIYFKGAWQTTFDPKSTAPAPFYVSPSSSPSVPLMYLSASVRSGESNGAQVFELPYARPKDQPGASMIVVLPKDRDGLPAVEAAVVQKGFAPFVGALGASQRADVWLPKLKMTLSFELGAPLAAMGMKTAFSDAADFSGIAKGGGLSISRVIHKAFVEVDEKGTEAAAATAVVISITSAQVHPTFRADHPFLFFVRDDRTGAIVFVGRVSDPSK